MDWARRRSKVPAPDNVQAARCVPGVPPCPRPPTPHTKGGGHRVTQTHATRKRYSRLPIQLEKAAIRSERAPPANRAPSWACRSPSVGRRRLMEAGPKRPLVGRQRQTHDSAAQVRLHIGAITWISGIPARALSRKRMPTRGEHTCAPPAHTTRSCARVAARSARRPLCDRQPRPNDEPQRSQGVHPNKPGRQPCPSIDTRYPLVRRLQSRRPALPPRQQAAGPSPATAADAPGLSVVAVRNERVRFPNSFAAV